MTIEQRAWKWWCQTGFKMMTWPETLALVAALDPKEAPRSDTEIEADFQRARREAHMRYEEELFDED